MRRAWLPLVFAAVFLSGCYESQDLLLDRDKAQQAFAAGLWTRTDEDGKISQLRLTPRADGFYDIDQSNGDEAWEHHSVLFNDLGKSHDTPRYAYVTYDTDEGAYIYGVVAVNADGSLREKTSDCHRKEDTRIATQMGGAQKLVDSCQFKTEAGLLAALRALADTPKHWDQIRKS